MRPSFFLTACVRLIIFPFLCKARTRKITSIFNKQKHLIFFFANLIQLKPFPLYRGHTAKNVLYSFMFNMFCLRNDCDRIFQRRRKRRVVYRHCKFIRLLTCHPQDLFLFFFLMFKKKKKKKTAKNKSFCAKRKCRSIQKKDNHVK